jgi:hypothetical protein
MQPAMMIGSSTYLFGGLSGASSADAPLNHFLKNSAQTAIRQDETQEEEGAWLHHITQPFGTIRRGAKEICHSPEVNLSIRA